ncbi:hypothetical protein DXB22_14935 [Clostridiaceae bacterium OM02-2AC]|nr:hypothetical protein DXB22_14935 [Clostridiaceae bacterium OM02-2AC]
MYSKPIVANHLSSKCEIGVSYAIGKSQPVSVFIDTFGTNNCLEDVIEDITSKA